MDRVEDKVCIVTGGALGIGRAAGELLAAEGAKVALTDIKDEEGRKCADELNRQHKAVRYWHLDVSREEEVKDVFQEVVDTFGGLDVLVNNAGISGANKPTHEVTTEEWDRLMDVNVRGVFLCTKYAVPFMREAGRGSIINLSSIYGIVGNADMPPYHASKGAVRLMSKTDALFYAGDNIRVNSVHPGYIWTPLVEALGRESGEGLERFRQRLDSYHPVGHAGEPKDIACGILFLSSDESKFMTGSELVIDGGYTAR